MINFNTMLRATLLACVSIACFVCTVQADTWYKYTNIRSILIHGSSLEITLEGSEDCDKTFRLSKDSDNYDVKATALMSAYYGGHEVSVYYSGDLNSCYTVLTRLKVRP